MLYKCLHEFTKNYVTTIKWWEKFIKGVMLMLCMKQRTTIQIEHKTLEKMKKLRITKRETYDEILNRLMEYFLNKKE